jgi:hypothetical protein
MYFQTFSRDQFDHLCKEQQRLIFWTLTDILDDWESNNILTCLQICSIFRTELLLSDVLNLSSKH